MLQHQSKVNTGDHMDFFDKLLGRNKASDPPVQQPAAASPQSADERALAQYRYMLQTAPPETIEQAHAEAFAKLSPEQRSMLLNQLTTELPEAERSAAGAKDDPQSLARLATRAEVRQPGAMERNLGGMGGRGAGMAGMMAGSFLTTIAGVVVGSAIAQSFFGDSSSASGQSPAEESAEGDGAGADGDMGGDFGGDSE
jgi:multidrug efflux pump subunit AcrA (membrane-fusion protein)